MTKGKTTETVKTCRLAGVQSAVGENEEVEHWGV